MTQADTLPRDPPLRGLRQRVRHIRSYYDFLKVQRIKGFTISEAPEFEAGCTPFFLERLSAAASYLEFGSGGSTILVAKAGIPFVSVDSDRYFLRAVQRKVKALGLHGENQTYLYADIGLTEHWGIPFLRDRSAHRLKLWRRYPTAPWAALSALPGPHLILVDGRFRAACALSAAKFLQGREGEILFDDYMDRPYYHRVERFLDVKRSVGRMALLKPRADIDPTALDAEIEELSADWR